MNYFDEYQIYNEDEISYYELNKIDNSYYFNNIEVENNRAIVGDLVVIKDKKVINIKKRNEQKIVGYINLNSQYKMKINNKVYQIFTPLNKKFEQFYVSFSSKKHTGTIYVIINFKCWEKNSKCPHGNLIDIIGKVGKYENDIMALMYNHNVFQKKMNIDLNKIKNDQQIIDNLKDCDYKIFTIDPKGSKDLDDGFHFKKIENGFEIGIHIACPIIFLKEYLLDIMKRCTTIYTYKNINLIPDIYSENICSLLEKKYRKTLSIILKFNNDLEYNNLEIKESNVYVMKNYDYDSFDEKHFHSDRFKNWVKLSETYFNTKLDSHTIVEKWMICANKLIANHLIENNHENIILRVFEEKESDFNSDEILNKIIHQYKQEAAIYQIYNPNEKLKFIHSGFDNSYYTHFTSPIRRAIDFYNQCLILNKTILSQNELFTLLNNYTIYEKNLKKFYRNQELLKFINENDTNILEEEAYIIQIKSNKLKLYLPNHKLEISALLFKYKFMDLMKASYTFENDYITYMNYTNDEINYEYKLYEKINVEIYFYPTELNIFDKIKVKIK